MPRLLSNGIVTTMQYAPLLLTSANSYTRLPIIIFEFERKQLNKRANRRSVGIGREANGSRSSVALFAAGFFVQLS